MSPPSLVVTEISLPFLDGYALCEILRSNTDFGWNVGGGAMGFFSDHVGIRGDVRFLQSVKNDLKDNALFTNTGRFGFWRVTGGVVFRFRGM